MNNPLNLALELNDFGLATIPIEAGKKKAAVRWKRFQHIGPSAAQLPLLFEQDRLLTVGVLCGEPSDRLMVLDCDNERVLDRMLQDLQDPKTWIVKTSRGGHIYLRTPVPVKSTRGDGFDVKAQPGYVLAPGAVHPTGVLYEYLRKTKNILELPSLDEIPGLVLDAAPMRPESMPPLAWQLFQGKGWEQYDNDASRVDAAIVSALLNKNYSSAEILRTFERFTLPRHAYSKHKRMGTQEGERYLNLTIERCSAHIQAHESEPRQIARGLQAWAMGANWPGKSGGSDRAVYIAHAQIAQRAARLTYDAGVRELAERAGVSIRTASKASERLCRAQLIAVERKSNNRYALARTWKLSPREDCCISIHIPPSKCEDVYTYTTPGHDVFRAKGLGKAAAHVWAVLQSGEGLKIGELARRTGRDRVTVWRAIRIMQREGMVRAEIAGNAARWFACKGIDLAAIAKRLGTDGTGARQMAKHRAQREGHKIAMGYRQRGSGQPPHD